MDTYHRISEEQRSVLEQAALMPETLDIFEGGRKQTKDYQGMFDSVYFIVWMKKLLDELNARGLLNAIVVMNNTIYQKSLPDGTAGIGWRKADISQAAADSGLYIDPGMTEA